MLHKAIKGYEDYLVSDTGLVYSLKTGKYLKGGCSQGYRFVLLYKNGDRVYKRVHRLVAETFIENPENKATVDHINRIRTDNRVENLRWADMNEQNTNREMTSMKETLQKKNGRPIVEKINAEASLGYSSVNCIPNLDRSAVQKHIDKNQSHFYCKGREFYTAPKPN